MGITDYEIDQNNKFCRSKQVAKVAIDIRQTNPNDLKFSEVKPSSDHRISHINEVLLILNWQ